MAEDVLANSEFTEYETGELYVRLTRGCPVPDPGRPRLRRLGSGHNAEMAGQTWSVCGDIQVG